MESNVITSPIINTPFPDSIAGNETTSAKGGVSDPFSGIFFLQDNSFVDNSDPLLATQEDPLESPSQTDREQNYLDLINKLKPEAATYKIMELVQILITEMRRSAAEAKQDAFQAEWTAHEGRAKELKTAADKDHRAAIVNGSMAVAGGILGMGASGAAFMSTRSSFKLLKADTPVTSRSSMFDSMRSLFSTKKPTPQPPASTGSQNAVASAVARRPSSASQPADDLAPAPAQAPRPPSSTEPAVDNVATNAAGSNGQVSDEVKKRMADAMNSRAQSYASGGMTLGQSMPAIGNLSASGTTLEADLARVRDKLQEAELTKAQADVDSEAEFTSKLTDGIKAIQDALMQLQELTHQTMIKVMS